MQFFYVEIVVLPELLFPLFRWLLQQFVKLLKAGRSGRKMWYMDDTLTLYGSYLPACKRMCWSVHLVCRPLGEYSGAYRQLVKEALSHGYVPRLLSRRMICGPPFVVMSMPFTSLPFFSAESYRQFGNGGEIPVGRAIRRNSFFSFENHAEVWGRMPIAQSSVSTSWTSQAKHNFEQTASLGELC